MIVRESFFDVPQVTLKTSAGEAPFPILYYDATALLLFYWCDPEPARALLEGTGLAPIRFFNGKALAGMGWYEYRKTDIGPYNEVGLAVAAAPEGRLPRLPLLQFLRRSASRALGFYIIDLPVTTDIACAAGREMWGYPKFVTRIPIDIHDGEVSAAVHHPESGEPIVRLSGRLRRSLTAPGFNLVLYSHLENALLRTEVVTTGTVQTALRPALRVETGPASHPMAEHVRRFGLDGAAPFACQFTPHFRSRLYLGQKVE